MQANKQYVIWRWDYQYVARVTHLAEHRIACEWKRMEAGEKMAASVAFRNGKLHREQPAKFGR